MRIFLALLLALLGGCGERTIPAAQGSDIPPPPPPLPTCPTAPANSGITIRERSGLDFHVCEGETAAGDRFTVYVGNFPEKVPGLQFYAPMHSRGKTFVWFVSSRREPGQTRQWVAYVPYGENSPSVAAISFDGKTRDDFSRVATAIESLAF